MVNLPNAFVFAFETTDRLGFTSLLGYLDAHFVSTVAAGIFVWLPLGEDTMDFAAACEAAGIAVRPFAGDGARISIGDHEANEAMLAVAAANPPRH